MQNVQFFNTLMSRLVDQRKLTDLRREETDKYIMGSDWEGSKINYVQNVIQTLSAHFWARGLQTPKTWGVAKGRDQESKKYEAAYNTAMRQLLKRIDFPTTMNESISKYGLPYGYFVYKLYWNDEAAKQERQKYATSLKDRDIQDPISIMTGAIESLEEGLILEAHNPKNFYKDSSCLSEKYQTIALVEYKDYFELKDMGYSISREILKTLAGQTDSSVKQNFNYSQNAESEKSLTKKIKVVTFHGNFYIDNKEYRNHKCVILDDSDIIYFSPQSSKDEIIVHGELYPAHDRYGLSPVDFIKGIQSYQDKFLDNALLAVQFNVNPACFVAEGSIPSDMPILKPGDYVPVKLPADRPDIQLPVPIQVRDNVLFPYFQMFESQVEALTGATRQLSGNITSNDSQQTATEFKGLQIVGSIILTRLFDQFNQSIKGKVIKNLMAMYAQRIPTQIRVFTIDKMGQEEEVIIPQNVFTLTYEYDFTDIKDDLERKQYLQEKTTFVTSMLQLMGQSNPQDLARVDIFGFLREGLLDYGEKEVKFFSDQEVIENELNRANLSNQVQSALTPPPPPPPTQDDLIRQAMQDNGLNAEDATVLVNQSQKG